ncbi:hypothetical protein MLD52_14785 [Puniceicoccaceae bacterium K14]|nr:hypothetical protein [Puniceicoccaceae bacterium K14]
MPPKKTYEQNLLEIEKEVIEDPTKFANEAADNAVSVAMSVAQLGVNPMETSQLAQDIFDANKKQIQLIERLYNLDPIQLDYPLVKSVKSDDNK